MTDSNFLRVEGKVGGGKDTCKDINPKQGRPSNEIQGPGFISEILDKFESALQNHKNSITELETIFFVIKANIDNDPDEVTKILRNLQLKITKIGSLLYQNFSEELTELEAELLCAIHRKGQFTQHEIRTFPRGKCHRNHLYHVLRKMSDKGFIKDIGSGKKHYILTDQGKKQAMWHISRKGAISI